VRVAHALKTLPDIDARYESGRLSWEKIVLITTIATPDDDEWWAELAETSNYAYLEAVVRYRRSLKRLEAQRQIRERSLSMRTDQDGVLRLTGRIPGVDGATVRKAIELLAEQVPPDPESQTYGAFHRRCADALVELSSARLAADADPDRATVVVHIDARDLNHINGQGLPEYGTPVAAEAARRLCCDGRVQLVAAAESGEPVGVGRVTRTVPPWLMRELWRRDRGCRYADCGRTRGVQAHHVIHWAHGGPTDLDNLVLLCKFHHRLVHEGGFRIIKDSFGRLRFVRPSGIALRGRAARIRPEFKKRIFGPPNRRRRRATPARL